MSDNWLFVKKAELLALECEMQGMIAEDNYRRYYNSPPAHSMDDFLIIADKVNKIKDQIFLKENSNEVNENNFLVR